MGFISHCQQKRRATTHFLVPALCSKELLESINCSNLDSFKWIVLHILPECPKCHLTIYEYHTIDWYGRKGHQLSIPEKKHPLWDQALLIAKEHNETTQHKKNTQKASTSESLISQHSQRSTAPSDVALGYFFWKRRFLAGLKTLHKNGARSFAKRRVSVMHKDPTP